jgi:ribosomal protein S18 acetylase RimI-like enzyme
MEDGIMRKIFEKNGWLFELTVPEYETANFGCKMSELRLLGDIDKIVLDINIIFSIDSLAFYMKEKNIYSSTFKGKENINIIRLLNDIGFKFVGTFTSMYCTFDSLKKTNYNPDYDVVLATKEDYSGILELEAKVFDYSSYQLDDRFLNEITAKRNVKRVESYFNNPKHICYVIKDNDKVIGFIQAISDAVGIIQLVNGALDPDYHGKRIGKTLYYLTFLNMFMRGGIRIDTNFCTQNIPVLKINQELGFQFSDQEIHLRLKL